MRLETYLILREGWRVLGSVLTRRDALILVDMIFGKERKKQSRKRKTAEQRIRRRLKPYRTLIRDMAAASINFYFPLPHRRPPGVPKSRGHGPNAYEYDAAHFYS